MENLEDDMAEIIGTTITDLEVEVITSENPSPPVQRTEHHDNSVILIEPTVDCLDLTSPQPSTSSSSGSSIGVGACSLLKTNLGEAFKEAAAETLPSAALDQNPGSSSASAATASTSNSSTTNVLECPICLQTCIHPARLPCGHIFCFLCVKGVAYKNRRCAMCRREIPPEFLDHPQLVNGIEDISTTKATDDGYQWFYEGRNGWWQYDDRTSQDLEEAFKKGERSCTILVAGYVYIVDFDAMIQQRQNEPARCRRVKRDLATIPKKGVAGLRIEGNTVTTDSNFAAQVYQSRQNRYRNGDLLNDGDLDNGIISPILRSNAAIGPPSPNSQGRLSYGGLGGYVIELGNPSEFVSTAAATDAALRIASDIIGSTLALADEITRSGGNINSPSSSSPSAYNSHHAITNSDTPNSTPVTALNNTTGGGTTTTTTGGQLQPMTGGSVGLSRERGSRELLGAAEDLLGATQRVIATADQPTIDLFEQTLNDFHVLTLLNILDGSDDEADDDRANNEQHHTAQQNNSPPFNPDQRSQSNNQENP